MINVQKFFNLEKFRNNSEKFGKNWKNSEKFGKIQKYSEKIKNNWEKLHAGFIVLRNAFLKIF